MTDIIVESKDGKRIHQYIMDDWPAIVYVRPGGTIRVKRSSEPEKVFLNKFL